MSQGRRPFIRHAAPPPTVVNAAVPFSLGAALDELGAAASSPSPARAPPSTHGISHRAIQHGAAPILPAGSKRGRASADDTAASTSSAALSSSASPAVQPRTIDDYVHALVPHLGIGIAPLMMAHARARPLRDVISDAPSPATRTVTGARGAKIALPGGKMTSTATATVIAHGVTTGVVKRELTGAALRSHDGEDMFLRAAACCPLQRLVHPDVLSAMARMSSDTGAARVLSEAGEPACTPLHLLPHTPTYSNTRELFRPSGAPVAPAWPGTPLVYAASFAALLLEEARACMCNALHTHLRGIAPSRGPQGKASAGLSRARWRIALAPVSKHSTSLGTDTVSLLLITDTRVQQRDVNTRGRRERGGGGADANDADTWQPRDMLLCVRDDSSVRERAATSAPLAFIVWVTGSARSHGSAASTSSFKLTARALTNMVPESVFGDDDGADAPAAAAASSSAPAPAHHHAWHVFWCGSVGTALQSYQSLDVLTVTPFAGAIMRTHTAQARPLGAAQRALEAGVTPQLWTVLQERYDASQLAAIALMCAGGQYHVPYADTAGSGAGGCELTCVVGPPGTGKTRTLIGALSAMRAMKLRAVATAAAASKAAASSAAATMATLTSTTASSSSNVILGPVPDADDDVHVLSRAGRANRATPADHDVIDLTNDVDTSALPPLHEDDDDDDVLIVDADSDATVPEVPYRGASVEPPTRTATTTAATSAFVQLKRNPAASRRARGPKRSHISAYEDVEATMLAPPSRTTSRSASVMSLSSFDDDDSDEADANAGLGLLRDVMRPPQRSRAHVQATIVPVSVPAPAPMPIAAPVPRSQSAASSRGTSFRVLVCAPSNAAVDEIVSRLLAPVELDATSGMCDENGRPYVPRVLRLGAGAASTRRFTTSDAVGDAIVTDRYHRAVIATAATRGGSRAAPHASVNDAASRLERTIAERQRELAQLEAAAPPSSHGSGTLSTLLGMSSEGSPPQHARAARELLLSPVTARRAAALRDEIARMDTKARFERIRYLLTDAEHAMCAARALHECVCEAEIVVCTLSSSARLFASAAASLPYGHLSEHIDVDAIPGSRFDAFIIDEAGQAIEPEACIPLRHAFAGYTHTRRPDMRAEEMCASATFHSVCRRLVLVGDPIQLPATVISSTAAAAGLHTSLFERLARSGCTPHILQMQYRMPPAISAFASAHFYGGMVHDAPRPAEHVHEHTDACLTAALLVCEVTGDEERARDRMGEEIDPTAAASVGTVAVSRVQVPHMSYSNMAEARAACAVALHLADALPAHTQADLSVPSSNASASVGIITPYRGQVSMIQSLLHDARDATVQRLRNRIIVSTVDSFQGQEMAAIVISFVRSQSRASRGALGFLTDARRLNVALTRARTCLALVGNMPYLAASDDDFRALYAHARDVGRRVYVSGGAPSSSVSSSDAHACERLTAWLRTRDTLTYPQPTHMHASGASMAVEQPRERGAHGDGSAHRRDDSRYSERRREDQGHRGGTRGRGEPRREQRTAWRDGDSSHRDADRVHRDVISVSSREDASSGYPAADRSYEELRDDRRGGRRDHPAGSDRDAQPRDAHGGSSTGGGHARGEDDRGGRGRNTRGADDRGRGRGGHRHDEHFRSGRGDHRMGDDTHDHRAPRHVFDRSEAGSSGLRGMQPPVGAAGRSAPPPHPLRMLTPF